jgi:tRNA threonylcarbamoyladenosine biosynthesis protein TsaE
MYLGVHYLTDVLVGFCVGWALSYVMYRFVRIKNEKPYKWFLLAAPVYLLILILLDSETVAMIGSFAIAAVVGIYLENRFVKYDIKRYNNKWIKLLIGYGVLSVTVVAFYFIPNISKYILALKYLSYGFEVTVLVPFILSKLKGRDMMTSNNVKDTEQLAKLIAGKMQGGEVILLNGDLGCGKTVFARGFINAFGVTEPVTSPTFTIVNKYTGSKGNIYHFDMYRLEDEEEALAAGLDELIDEPSAIKLIEWPEKAAAIIPDDAIVINITKIDDNTRSFDIKGIEI